MGREAARAVGIGHMNDQRMIGRPALGGEDFRDRGIVVGPRTESVHRLGRKCHQFPRRQGRGRAIDDCAI